MQKMLDFFFVLGGGDTGRDGTGEREKNKKS